MLGEALDAATAGYRVGYESPSQFSRECRRFFGELPRRNMARLCVASPGDRRVEACPGREDGWTSHSRQRGLRC
jgi:AraC-like DNA-binding protein